MHSIERYGIVALLFLVVTVVAVLMWDGGKGKKKESLAGGPAAASAARAPERSPDGRAAGRRLSLAADAQPGPLLRQPVGRDAPMEDGLPASAEPASEPAPLSAPVQQALPPAEPPATGSPSVEPAREPVVGRAPAGSTHVHHAYTVRAGDTLSEIAQRELGSARRWQEIVAANPGLDPARLRVGKTIQLPGPAPAAGTRAASTPAGSQPASEAPRETRTWKVGRGENLWKIAARTLGDGKRWREIAALNPRVDPDRLKLGQVLTLPAAGPARKAAPARSERPTLVAGGGSERQASRGRRVR